MSTADLSQRHPRMKLAAIPLLAAILWIVLPSSPNAAHEEPVVELNTDGPRLDRRHSPRPATGMGTMPIPIVTLAEALGFDPFAVPDSMREPVEEPVELKEIATAQPPSDETLAAPAPSLDHLQSLKVSAVVRGPRGVAALIGSDTFRVGDLIEPGVRVVEIQSDRVLLRVENGKTAKSGEISPPALH
jgi:hypothetical protein